MTTYAQLIANLQSWTEDDGTEFVAELPNIVARAEDKCFGVVPNLLSYRADETGTLSTTDPEKTFTATYIREIRSLFITVSSSKTNLIRVEESFIDAYWPDTSVTGVPVYYARVTPYKIRVAPTPDAGYGYTCRFTAMPTRLTAANQNTFLGDTFPRLIEKAALVEAGTFLQYNNNPESGEVFSQWLADFDTEALTVQAEVERDALEHNTQGA